jgi:hypothetical protein
MVEIKNSGKSGNLNGETIIFSKIIVLSNQNNHAHSLKHYLSGSKKKK